MSGSYLFPSFFFSGLADTFVTQGQVKVRGFGFNPHIVEEEEDDLEVVDEVAGADDDVVEVESEEDEGPGSPVSPDSMKRKRKAAKARRS